MADQGSGTTSGVPALLSDWVGLIKSVPGLLRIVTRLVGSIAELGSATVKIGTSLANSKSAEIESLSANRIKVIDALGNAALTEAKNDPHLADRALRYFSGKLIREQINREDVTLKALSLIENDAADGSAQEIFSNANEVSEDWLDIFSSYAEKANSDKLRQHWAKILAGEIRKPQTISLQTLHLASLIDTDTAAVIEEVCGYITFDDMIPNAAPFESGTYFLKLKSLAEIGFVTLNSGAKFFEFRDNEAIQFDLGDEWMIVQKRVPNLFEKLHISGSFLTQAGAQFMSLIDIPVSPGRKDFTIRAIASSGFPYTMKPKQAEDTQGPDHT